MPFDLTAHEIASAVLDKGLLGLVAVGFGYWLNRRMEIFRSQRATAAEFLRERTKRLDELHALMLEVEYASDRYSIFKAMETRGIVVDSGRGPGQAKVTSTDETAREYRERYAELALKLSQRTASVRPWIGDVLATACDQHVDAVKRGTVEMTALEEPDWGMFLELQKETAELREMIVAEIRRGAPAPPTPKKTP